MKKNIQYILILLVILAMASFFRFYNLGSIPPGVYPDEAINANQAISEPGRIFYPENGGREGLFINLIQLSFYIFGISIWSLKFVSAIIGVLTVLGLYLLTKELLQTANYKLQTTNSIALLSSFFLALSFWHINFSRIAFRAILVPFCLVFLFYFLFRGFRTKKLSNFVISGIFFGLGFHTYIAFRLAVLLVLLILILWWLIYKKENQQKRFFIFTACFLLTTFFVALPIGIYFLNHPEDFISRAGNVSIFSQANPVLSFGKSLVLHLGMFNFSGDFNWRHNISGRPILFWPVGILFLIGLIYSISELIKAKKNKNYSLSFVHCSLLGWWFIMLLPGALTFEGIPHCLRVIGSIPPTFIFAGMGGWLVLKRKTAGWLSLSLLILLTALFIYGQYSRYFILWGKNSEVEGAFSKDYVSMGNYLNSLSKDIKKYVIVNQSGTLVKGIPMPAQTVMFVENIKYGKPQSNYLLPQDLDKIKTDNKKTIIIPMRYDKDLFSKLSQKFPQGKIQIENGIWIYEII